jgi:hypothetical protein
MSQDTMITFKSGQPKLTPDVLGADAAVLTITEFRRNQQTRIGAADVVVFKEFPQHGWYANTTSLKAIAAVYGPDYSKWIGKQVPLEARSSTVVGSQKQTRTLWCAGAVSSNDPFDKALWDKALRGARRVSKK